MTNMEWILEKRERLDRKNNIVIKGVSWRTEGLGQAVEEFIKENLA